MVPTHKLARLGVGSPPQLWLMDYLLWLLNSSESEKSMFVTQGRDFLFTNEKFFWYKEKKKKLLI